MLLNYWRVAIQTWQYKVFQVKELASDPTTGRLCIGIIMEIGTNNQDALDHNRDKTLDTMDVTCKPPSDDSSVQNFYCN